MKAGEQSGCSLVGAPAGAKTRDGSMSSVPPSTTDEMMQNG